MSQNIVKQMQNVQSFLSYTKVLQNVSFNI